MSGHLVDTNVISAGAPGRAEHAPPMLRAMETNANSLHLSVVTIAEIEAGIARSRRDNAGAESSTIDRMAGNGPASLRRQVLPIDVVGLTLLTGNSQDFVPLGVAALDPFEAV